MHRGASTRPSSSDASPCWRNGRHEQGPDIEQLNEILKRNADMACWYEHSEAREDRCQRCGATWENQERPIDWHLFILGLR